MNFDDIEKKIKEDGEKRANAVDKDKILQKALSEPASERNEIKTPDAFIIGGGYVSGKHGNAPIAAAVAAQPKNKFNKLAFAAVIIASLALIGTALIFAFSFLNGNSSGNVPVYLGMQVSSVNNNGNIQIMRSSLAVSGDHTGKHDEIDQESPFGESNTTLETELQGVLDVLPESKIDYYAKQNDDILITVKLSNPDDYIILSFSLNGVVYQSYQFQDGSDSENLILKINVKDASGIAAYTIDAIKYIDGQEIKDAIFGGDKTVKVGVKSDAQLTAEVSGQSVGLNAIAFNVDIADRPGLLEPLGGILGAVLFDGDKIVGKQILNVGTNAVSFTGLMSNKIYQYAVYAHYNNLTGKNSTDLNLLAVNAVATRPTVLFSTEDIVVGKESIDFALWWDENAVGASVDYIDLYQGGQRLRTLSGNSASGLLSGNTYEIRLGYKNILGGSEAISLTFTTGLITAAELEIVNAVATKDSITFDLNVSDPDNVGQVTAIQLYNGSEKIAELDDYTTLEFTNLAVNTVYQIRVTYSYNLNDGEGIRTFTEVQEILTLIDRIEITSILILDENPREGEFVNIVIGYKNESNVRIDSFYFGAKKVTAVLWLESRAALNFVPDMVQGELQILPTAVEYTLNGVTRTIETIIPPGVIIGVSSGETYFADFYADAQSNRVSVGETYDLIVELVNPSGYLAYGVTINDTLYSGEAITQFGNNRIIINMPAATVAGEITYTLTKIELMGLTGTLELIANSSCIVIASE